MASLTSRNWYPKQWEIKVKFLTLSWTLEEILVKHNILCVIIYIHKNNKTLYLSSVPIFLKQGLQRCVHWKIKPVGTCQLIEILIKPVRISKFKIEGEEQIEAKKNSVTTFY